MNDLQNFKAEVRDVLSGYLQANDDIVNYIVTKIARLHEEYSNKEREPND